MEHKDLDHQIYWELAELQFQCINNEESNDCYKIIAEQFEVPEEKVRHIAGIGSKEMWECPEYPAGDHRWNKI